MKGTVFALFLLASLSLTASSPYPTVINPVIPHSYTFCGEKIDLDRVDMFERFDRELTSLVYSHGNTLLTIKRANRDFPVMAPILASHGVPRDLLYLACVESYLNPRALSPAKAAGVWQFLPETARQYGLEVSDEVDERYHLAKATDAAARYLKSAYDLYGDWPSAIASYNGGRARISRELDSQLASSAFDLYLTEETSRYVFRIMAMKAILEDPRAFGFRLSDDQLYRPLVCDTVTVSGPVPSWPVWARDHGITYAQLRDANPWIRAKSLTNKSNRAYQVLVPRPSSLRRS